MGYSLNSWLDTGNQSQPAEPAKKRFNETLASLVQKLGGRIDPPLGARQSGLQAESSEHGAQASPETS